MTYNYSLNSQNINLNNLAGNSQAQYAQNMQNEPVSIFQTQNKATSNNIEADDGKISFGSKIKNIAKGIIKPITTMFSSPKNFIMGAAAIAGGVGLIALTGGAATPILVAAGVTGGGIQLVKGAVNASKATTDAEAEAAWQDIGTGGAAVVGSVAGAKSALKSAGCVDDVSNMSALQATKKCFTSAPKQLNASINNASTKITTAFKGLKGAGQTVDDAANIADDVIIEEAEELIDDVDDAVELADDADDLIKSTDKTDDVIELADEFDDAVELADDADDLIKSTDKTDDVIELADEVDDAVELADDADDLIKSTDKTNDTIEVADDVDEVVETVDNTTEATKIADEAAQTKKMPGKLEDISFENGIAKKDGQVFSGTVEGTLKSGEKVTLRYDDGRIKVASKTGDNGYKKVYSDFENSKEIKTTFTDGSTQTYTKHANGTFGISKADGTVDTYYKSGQKKTAVLADGTHEKYYENGNLKSRRDYNSDIFEAYYENGQIETRFNAVKGTSERWYENGQAQWKYDTNGNKILLNPDGTEYFDDYLGGLEGIGGRYGLEGGRLG